MSQLIGPNISFDEPERIRQQQNAALRRHLRYCLQASPFYRDKLAAFSGNTDTLTTDTLSDLPFTEKTDIEQNNDRIRAVSMADIREIVMSSGTTGRPTRIMYSEKDMQRLAYNEETALRGCGIGPTDIALLTCTMDRCFIAGAAYWLGLRRIGASAVRSGQNTLEGQAVLVRRLQPNVIVGVPSFLIRLGRHLAAAGADPGSSPVKRIVCIGEPLRRQDMQTLTAARELEKLWSAQLFSTYASSETITAFCECREQKGGHLIPELAIVEIVDEDGTRMPAGEVGEVVITPLAMEAMPLVRFRTGDVSFLLDGKCGCGRHAVRLGPILGRKKQMMKVHGTTIYPQAIFSLLEEMKTVDDFFMTAVTGADGTDEICVRVSLCKPGMSAEAIENRLQAELRVKPTVEIVSTDEVHEVVFNPIFRKPVRFFDQRKPLP